MPAPAPKVSWLGSFLGYAVVFGSGSVKVPQILNLMRAKSSTGLSQTMFVLETGCQLATALYHVTRLPVPSPFSVYGENVLLGSQNVVILYLLAKQQNAVWTRFVGGMSFAVVALVLLLRFQSWQRRMRSEGRSTSSTSLRLPTSLIAVDILSALQSVVIGVYIFSRIPQILMNFQRKSTGVLSLATFSGNFAGSLVRLFSAKEIQDPLMTVTMLASLALNATLVGQILFYRRFGVPTVRGAS